MSIFNKNNNKGFTLIEMVVSLGIFSVVAVIALGALVKIISANRKAQSLQSSLTNLNFAVESITRELRVGRAFHCDGAASPAGVGHYNGTVDESSVDYFDTAGCDTFSKTDIPNSNNSVFVVFKSSRTDTVTNPACGGLATAYQFINRGDSIKPDIRLEKIQQTRCNNAISGNPDFSSVNVNDLLSPQNVKITDFRISVGPYDPSEDNFIDGEYPRVYIRLMGYAGERVKDQTFFDIQTSVAQRTQK